MRKNRAAAWKTLGGGRERFRLRDVLPRFLAWLVPVTALLVVYAVVLYQRELDGERRVHEQESLRAIDVGTEVVTRDLESVVADLKYLAGRSGLRDYMTHLPGARARLEEDFRLFSLHKAAYDQIRILAVDGMEIVRIDYDGGAPVAARPDELQSKAAREYFADSVGLGPGEIYVSPFDLNVEHGEIVQPIQPVIRFATPVFQEGRVAGVLVLNYLGERLFQKVREISSGYRGEIALINDDGFYLLHPRSPEAEWGFQLGPGPTFATDYPAVWKSVSTGRAGQVLTPDGLFTFRRVGPRAAPKRGLILVSHLSVPQLAQDARAMLRQVLSVYSLAGPVLLGLIGYLAFAGAVRLRHHRLIAESEARLRALSAQVLTAQERERASLSRDLHDDLGQLVTTVGLDLERAAQTTDPREKDRLVALALVASKVLMQKVRAISTQLRPRILDDLGLKDATRSFLEECREHLGLDPQIDLRFEREAIPPRISENVYRILQEAVTNVAKHSGTRRLSVGLAANEGGVRLRVRDAGSGFDPQSVGGKGLGLLGMRERVELLGGTFRLRSRPGGGTEIDALIPLPPRDGKHPP